MVKLELFKSGLKRLNLDPSEIINNYSYAGGTHEKDFRYFQLLYPGKAFPDHRDHCVCGHRLKWNCYITNGKREYDSIMVVGKCCITAFMKHCRRTCEVCNNPHQRRKTNICTSCERSSKRCIGCGHESLTNNKITIQHVEYYACCVCINNIDHCTRCKQIKKIKNMQVKNRMCETCNKHCRFCDNISELKYGFCEDCRCNKWNTCPCGKSKRVTFNTCFHCK